MNASLKAEGKHMSTDFQNTGTVNRFMMRGRELCRHKIMMILTTCVSHERCNGP